MRLAVAMHAKMQQEDEPAEQIRMVLMGQAGCGKSQVMKAFMWHAWQHRQQQRIKLCSYQWRAARGSSTAAVKGVSTCHLFGINPNTGKTAKAAVRARVAQDMEEAWFIINDECSLNSAAHLAHCSHAASNATGQPLDVPFGGIHTVMAGDMMQHPPVGGTPLYKQAAGAAPAAAALPPQHPDVKGTRPAKAATAKHGRNTTGDSCGVKLWERFEDVYLLEQQHRQDESIRRHARLFMQETPPPDPKTAPEQHRLLLQQVTDLCEELQRRAVPELGALAALDPHVLVLRNRVRADLNRALATQRANHLGHRMVFWWSRDSLGGAPMSQKLRRELQGLPATDAQDMGALNYFFPGIHYLFASTENDQLEVNWTKNTRCLGRKITLDPPEPDDDLTKPYRLLQHLPLAVYVEPSGADLQGLRCGPHAPPACVPVTPRKVTFKHALPQQRGAPGRQKHVQVARTGLLLGDGYAVTDFYIQGMSFKDECWLLHLNVPPPGLNEKLCRASVLVALTRFKDLQSCQLVAPLWRPGNAAERQHVIHKFMAATATDPDLIRCMQRLRLKAAATKQRDARLAAVTGDRDMGGGP
jgi:hypothetical protein